MVKPFNGAPEFFISLQQKIDRLQHRADCLNDTVYNLKRSGCGRYFNTAPLSQAASKYLLAKNAVGLKTDGYIGADPEENYSGQLIFTLTVAAFETYCRMINKRWFRVYRDVFSEGDGKEFRRAISGAGIEVNFCERLARIQDDRNLSSKIIEFAEERDQKNFYSVCVGFRNAFSHGRLGSLNGTLPLSERGRTIVLKGIRRHCEEQTALIA